jgi:tetratricopeptide (TPR) repeat protein
LKHFLTFCIFNLSFLISIAQPQSNFDIARQYESTGEFDKSAVYYEKHYSVDPFNTYEPYLNCLIQLKDFDKAEKLIKKQMKKGVGTARFLVDLGELFDKQNEPDKAKKQYDAAIKSLLPDVGDVINTANAFFSAQKVDYAIEAYLTGRKLLNGSYPFSFELAEMYSQKGDSQKMIDEYMDMMAYNPQYVGNVQAIMQNKIANDLNGTLSEQLRTSLLRKIQKNPNELAYPEFLYWIFLQEKDFESAFIQAKSLDKKTTNDGSRVYSLGEICISNKAWSTAENCFKYILDKDKQGAMYVPARIMLVQAMSEKITGGIYSMEDLTALDNNYRKTFEELGTNWQTSELLKSFAHFNAFYFNKVDDAVKQLEDAISIPNVKPEFVAACKLELGDILILKNELWDASLYYSQVDKDFKHDAVGREAKYRNARLSYFLGEFDWAAAQLGILKQATSQLISNDAMALGLLITDNVGEDSIKEPLSIYSRAELLAYQNKFDLAITTLDSILLKFPGRRITDDVWFKKANIYEHQRKYADAVKNLQDIVDTYPDDVLADDAIFKLAALYETVLSDKVKAMEFYEKLIQKYPGSLFVSDARKKFRALRGDKIN